MATIRFETNKPLELRMRYLEGKPVESQFGGTQHMFTCEEGTFYVSETVGRILAEQFRKLGVKPGEPIDIIKAEVARGNRKSIEWQVAKVGTPEPPGELEHQLQASLDQVAARKAAAQAQAALPAWTEMLVTQTNFLVDAYAQVLKHSSRHEGLVKGEDIRSIFLSAFINVSKGANGRAA
jgi:hypothetical protein